MKSTSNIIQSPPKDHKFPHVKSHYYQAPFMGNQQMQLNFAYGNQATNQSNNPTNRSNLQSNKFLQKNEDSGNEKRSKQSESSGKYSNHLDIDLLASSNHFKSSYFQFATSQRKFNQKNKQAINLSHNIERSNNTIAKKKLTGIIDSQLPPLSYKPGSNLNYSDINYDQKGGVSNILMPRPSQIINGTNQNHLKQQLNNHKKSPNRESNSFQLENRQSQQGFLSNQEDEQDSPLLPLNSLPHIEPSKCSSKSVGQVVSYGANTHQGLVRNYNEDRVSIILNMMKPPTKGQDVVWPQCSFFAVYDGHGGSQCAEFLRDNLHYFIIRDDYFPQNPKMAIIRGYEKAEKSYLELADQGKVLDKSGSCSLSALIVDQMCYVANVGDSRAIASMEQGRKVIQITTDHKPNHPDEERRIIKLGGEIYQSQIPMPSQYGKEVEYITGPYRVSPGRLAVSRTMGDAEAKLPKYGGIPNVISAEPEVFSFKISEEYDYLLLGCDGIFDKLTNEEVLQNVWSTTLNNVKNVHEFTGRSIENVMKFSLQKKSFDNVTVVFLGFQSLERVILQKKQQQLHQQH